MREETKRENRPRDQKEDSNRGSGIFESHVPLRSGLKKNKREKLALLSLERRASQKEFVVGCLRVLRVQGTKFCVVTTNPEGGAPFIHCCLLDWFWMEECTLDGLVQPLDILMNVILAANNSMHVALIAVSFHNVFRKTQDSCCYETLNVKSCAVEKKSFFWCVYVFVFCVFLFLSVGFIEFQEAHLNTWRTGREKTKRKEDKKTS